MLTETAKSEEPPPLGLPAPPASEPAFGAPEPPNLSARTSDGRVPLDALGPIIVGTDGALSRIQNWANLTPNEQTVALRRIAQRNARRLEVLHAQTTTPAPADGDPMGEL